MCALCNRVCVWVFCDHVWVYVRGCVIMCVWVYVGGCVIMRDHVYVGACVRGVYKRGCDCVYVGGVLGVV